MKKRQTISLAYRASLIDMLRSDYTESGLSDADFAASIQTRFPTLLNATHVKHQREALSIPNNKARTVKPKTSIELLADEIASLKLAVAEIRARVSKVDPDTIF